MENTRNQENSKMADKVAIFMKILNIFANAGTKIS